MIKEGSIVTLKETTYENREKNSLDFCIKKGIVSYRDLYIVTRRYVTHIDGKKIHYICFIGDNKWEERLPVKWFYDVKERRNSKIDIIFEKN